METRKLGRFDVTLTGLGCNNFGMRCDEDQTAKVVEAALESGINFFDTADIYGAGYSEEFMGKALGSRRDEVIIATKFGAPMTDDPEMRGGNPKWIPRAAEASLTRLGTDRIDLYQMHFPDESVAIEDTLAALNRLVEEGKVLEIGSSNYSGEQITQAADSSAQRGLAAFVSAQNHYNLLHREPEPDVIAACEKHGMAMLPYFPLANGLLTGKYRRGEAPPEGARLARPDSSRASELLRDENLAKVEQLEAFAREREHSVLDLAFAWLAAQPTVASVIAGATTPEQVQANAKASSWSLSADDLSAIEKIVAPA